MANEDDLAVAREMLSDIESENPATVNEWADLSEQYLTIAQRFQQANDTDEAFAAAGEGIKRLSPAFLNKPDDLAEPMRALVSQYLALTEHSRHRADKAMLAPIAATLGDLIDDDDNDGDGD